MAQQYRVADMQTSNHLPTIMLAHGMHPAQTLALLLQKLQQLAACC
jgi:hypothetical protein